MLWHSLIRKTAIALGLAACLLALIWPAIDNRFPIFDIDSIRYINFRRFYTFSLPLYNLWLAPAYKFELPWIPVIAQAALAIAFVALAAKQLLGRVALPLVVIVCALSAGTFLPFLVSIFHPDLFASFGILAIALSPSASPRARILLAVFLFAAALTHYSNLFIFTSTALAAGAISLYPRFDIRGVAKMFAPAAAALLAVALALTAWNYFAFRKATLSVSGPVFVLAILQDDYGAATKFLRDRCPEAGFQTCREIDRLPLFCNKFLWGEDSVVTHLGGFEELSDEASVIVRGAILAYPMDVIRSVAKNTAQVMTKVSDFPLWLGSTAVFTEGIQANPDLLRGFRQSRQYDSKFRLTWLNSIYAGFMIVSACALGILLAASARRDGAEAAARFAAVLCMGAIANDILLGGLSGPFWRYGARVAWLIPFAALILAWRLAANIRAKRAKGG